MSNFIRMLSLAPFPQAAHRFMKKFNLSIWAASYVGQQIPKNSEGPIYSFLKEIINIRKIYDIDENNIINMDETALTMNIPSNKTVHKIGSKTICIKTQRQEKARVSVILAFCANGVKLKPFIIIKGAKNGCITKN